ncbi:MAG TPA: hypothetical protein PLO89_11115 [Spirochaetota bacterium]|nr:hypothetical protein [Spirochaetota bacterium]
MGKSTRREDTKFWWEFENISEIKGLKIVDKKQTKDKIDYILDIDLEDSDDKDKFYLRLSVTYKKVGDKWDIEKIYQEKYNKLK